MYGLSVVTPPAAEPLDLTRAKANLRVAHTADDALITGWITAARELTESHTGRRWVTQTLRLSLDDWPDPIGDGDQTASLVRLPVAPVQDVTAVRYWDVGGVYQTLDPARYQTWLDHSPPLLAPAPLKIWPVTQPGRIGAVQVEFTAGYGAADAVPEGAKAAVQLCLAYWYENRGDGRDPHGLPESLGLPPGAKRLLDSLWTGEY